MGGRSVYAIVGPVSDRDVCRLGEPAYRGSCLENHLKLAENAPNPYSLR
jgi:hypothetical protein